jgi:hypothetical protein
MRSLVLIVVLALLLGSPMPASGQSADMARFQRASLRVIQQEKAAEVLNKALKGKKPDEARLAGQQLAARGVIRLKAEDLKRRAELMLDFTGRAGKKVCGGWARGTVTPEQTVHMVAQLDSAAFDGWMLLSVRSMIAEVRGKPKAFSGSDKDITKMFGALATAMTPAENERFSGVMGRFEKASDEDACWFGQQLYRSALALKEKERDHALRTLAWIEVQPS